MKVVTVVVAMQVSNGVRMWCVIASIVSVLIAVSMCADMASADAITVVYRGTEVLGAQRRVQCVLHQLAI